MPASIKHLTDKKLNLTSLLARWKDGLYYTAAIVKCDKVNKRCLVCFEDSSEVWVNNKDVHIQLTLDQLNEDEDIVCCICDDGSSRAPNEIILCDVCQQGYHQKCHNPPVDSSKLDETGEASEHKDWFCATCSYILNQSDRSKLSATAQQQQQKQTTTAKEPKQQQQNQKLPPPQLQQKSSHHLSPPAQQPPAPVPTHQSKPSSQSKSQPELQTTTRLARESSPAQQQPQKSQPQQQQTLQKQQVTKQPKSTIGPVKTNAHNVSHAKQTPYYPLSHQARVAASSSTAALASMTASSALVVGSSAGRSKQDLVNQSNSRSSQRQRSSNSPVIDSVSSPTPMTTPTLMAPGSSPPVKHAVRKSSVNFVMPIKQSALPTATRSILPNMSPPSAKIPHMIATTVTTQPTTTFVSSPTRSPIGTATSTTKTSNINLNNNNINHQRVTQTGAQDKVSGQTSLQVPVVVSPKSFIPRGMANVESPTTLIVAPKSHQVSNKSIVADSSTSVTSSTSIGFKAHSKTSVISPATTSSLVASNSCKVTSLNNGSESSITPDSTPSSTSFANSGSAQQQQPTVIVTADSQQVNGQSRNAM